MGGVLDVEGVHVVVGVDDQGAKWLGKQTVATVVRTRKSLSSVTVVRLDKQSHSVQAGLPNEYCRSGKQRPVRNSGMGSVATALLHSTHLFRSSVAFPAWALRNVVHAPGQRLGGTFRSGMGGSGKDVRAQPPTRCLPLRADLPAHAHPWWYGRPGWRRPGVRKRRPLSSVPWLRATKDLRTSKASKSWGNRACEPACAAVHARLAYVTTCINALRDNKFSPASRARCQDLRQICSPEAKSSNEECIGLQCVLNGDEGHVRHLPAWCGSSWPSQSLAQSGLRPPCRWSPAGCLCLCSG